MMNRGEILIGTLFDFRQQENKERGDKNEGKKNSITSFPETVTINDAEEWERAGIFRNSNITYESGRVTFLKDTKVIRNEDVKDIYVYCCSKIYSQTLKEDFEADSCIEICDRQQFLLAVSNTLSQLGLIYPDLSSGRDCEYVGHEVDDATKLSANWLKDEVYKHQCEFRFSFLPLMKREGRVIEPVIKGNRYEFPNATDIEVSIKPELIRCKKAIKYCRWR